MKRLIIQIFILVLTIGLIFSHISSVTRSENTSKKVIAVSPEIKNQKSENHSNSGEPDCLSMEIEIPGRPAEAEELKTGHWKMKTKSVKCEWALDEYHFFSKLNFDISAVSSKKILRAELLITLSGTEKNVTPGTDITKENCTNLSRIFMDDKHIKSFSTIEEGVTKKINLIDSVREWAASKKGKPYTITIKGELDTDPEENSICLRYYTSPLLFVEYKE